MAKRARMFRVLVGLVGASIGLSGCSGSGTGPTGVFGQEKIVFASRRSGVADIYIMNPDGSGQQQLTDNMIFEQAPALSPRRDKVVYTAYEGGNSAIYLLDVATKTSTKLTPSGSYEDSPVFNPRTGEIVFSSSRSEDRSYQIFSMRPDGSGLKQLTHVRELYVDSPSVSADGKRIIFTGSSVADGPGGNIYVVGASGGESTKIIPTDESDFAADYNPQFSPDGREIVYVSYKSGSEIYIMKADGSNPRRLTTNNAMDTTPRFSPDGSKIIFASNRHEPAKFNLNLYVMNRDGSNVQRLTTTPEGDESPDWH